jgi:hypothetical protein
VFDWQEEVGLGLLPIANCQLLIAGLPIPDIVAGTHAEPHP